MPKQLPNALKNTAKQQSNVTLAQGWHENFTNSSTKRDFNWAQSQPIKGKAIEIDLGIPGKYNQKINNNKAKEGTKIRQ